MRLPREVLYYGDDKPLPEVTVLRAGPLTVTYEEGSLRYVRLGSHEVLRRIYVAVRDRNWETAPARISNVQKEVRDRQFRVSFSVENSLREIDFFWKGLIEGAQDGTLTFTMAGFARSTFLRNRIGFCVLHPAGECASRPCKVEEVDGSVKSGEFPLYVSPHQPFKNIRAICHEVQPGVWAEVRFSGDVFEMEDQRNWSDASYKTYSTPLHLPYPVEVKTGTRISQSVTLRLKGDLPDHHLDEDGGPVFFTFSGTQRAPLPLIGLGTSSLGHQLGPKEASRLRALNLAHLRVDLRPFEDGCETVLSRAATEASQLGVPLEIALTLSDDARGELGSLRSALEGIRPQVCRWLVFHSTKKATPPELLELARTSLSDYESSAKFGAGTNAHFAELNRSRPHHGSCDFVCYSLNPQVHAFDNATLVENLEAQGSMVKSAREFTAGLPVAVTPITMKPRFNPDATSGESDPDPSHLPPQADVRQMSLLGAGWTLGSLKHLCQSGTQSLTYYETTGWRGVMETEDGASLPEVFRSIPGAVFPLYHIFADAGEFAGGYVIPSVSSSPLKVEGMVLRIGNRLTILLGNLSAEEQEVLITAEGVAGSATVKYLDETNAERAMRFPEAFRAEPGNAMGILNRDIKMRLRPFAIGGIDLK